MTHGKAIRTSAGTIPEVLLWQIKRLTILPYRKNQKYVCLSLSSQLRSRYLKFAFLVFIAVISSIPFHANAQVAVRPLPEKKVLPINAESFCQGMPNVLKASIKQNAGQILSSLCNETNPTSLLRDLIENPYDSQQEYRFRDSGNGLFVGLMPDGEFVRFAIAFSMRVSGKSAVSLLLSEETIMRDQTYAKGDGDPAMNVRFEILKPDLKQSLLDGSDGDIAFKVSQRTVRSEGQRKFDNTTVHDLKLYRMIENNYDFMVGIRSLAQDLSTPAGEKPLFRKAVVIRAAITDPKDKNSAIAITLLDFEVSDQRNQEDRVENIFSSFVLRDLKRIYSFHQKK